MRLLFVWRISLSVLLIANQTIPIAAHFKANAWPLVHRSSRALRQGSTLSIREVNSVVNEGGQITLTATDTNGQPATGVAWESGSSDIAGVDPSTGLVSGKKFGFATITARQRS